jgi:hypothetical protein
LSWSRTRGGIFSMRTWQRVGNGCDDGEGREVVKYKVPSKP